MKFASLRLTVKDIKKTLAFYMDALGFKAVGIFPDKDRPAWATLVHEEKDADRFSLMFLEYGQMDPESPTYRRDFDRTDPGVGAQIYFNVDGVDALHERLLQKGVKTFIHPIETMPYGLREFTLRDPDGYLLTFCEEVKLDYCLSCGMPLHQPEIRGAGKPDNPYCCYCTDDKGRLLPRHDVEDKMVQYLVESGAPEEEARGLARELMEQQPAWRDA